jgi:hypothetical protein
LRIFVDAGYEVLDEEADIDLSTLEAVRGIKLTYPYSRMSPEQLAVLRSIYLMRRRSEG